MRWAWRNYREHAWGKDQIKPISGGFESFPLKNHHLGLTIVEALDTLWIMGLDDEFARRCRLGEGQPRTSMSMARCRCSRLPFGWSADCCQHSMRAAIKVLLAKARDLADRLLPSFNASPLGIPHRFINLRTGALRGTETNPAETGTFIPEFGFLSRRPATTATAPAAKRALASMFERRSKIGLLADAMDCMTGEWKSRRATIGPPSDSYYEYLWDGWDLLGDRECLAMYRTLTPPILKYQAQRLGGRLWFVDVDFETGERINWARSELASFYGGCSRKAARMRPCRLHAQLGCGYSRGSACCPRNSTRRR